MTEEITEAIRNAFNEYLNAVDKIILENQALQIELQHLKQENAELKEKQRPLEVDKQLYDGYCETHCRANDIAIDLHREFDFMEQREIIPIIKEGIRILRFQCNQYRSALEEINLILDELKQQYDYMTDYSEIKEIQDKINEVLENKENKNV